MTRFEWSDDYNTGIPDIDKDHHSLFALINDLNEKFETGCAEVSVHTTIQALVDYVGYHFEREEGLMDACDYPYRENHKVGHRKLQLRLEAFMHAHESNSKSFDMENFMEFLNHWIQHHILHSDMAYVPYVQSLVAKTVSHPLQNSNRLDRMA